MWKRLKINNINSKALYCMFCIEYVAKSMDA